MPKLNYFTLGTIVVSLIIGIVAILIFSGKFPGISTNAKTNENKPTLEVWGSFPLSYIDKANLAYTQATAEQFQFNYIYVKPGDLYRKMTEARAQGHSPDLILASHKELIGIANLTYVLPYTNMSQLEYNSTFIDTTHPFAQSLGAQFYPVLADPLITIYNKRILNDNGITAPPAAWAELPKYQTKITKYGTSGKPQISAFGLGANNVTNNEDILIASLMQLGHNPARVVWGVGLNNVPTQDFVIDIGLSNNSNVAGDETNIDSDLYKLLKYQTAFSNPQKTTYTWSEVETSDLDKFIAGEMAVYFGKASDLNIIRSANPNLDIGMFYLPQMANEYNITTGDIYGIAIANQTKYFDYSVETAKIISGQIYSSVLSSLLGVSSARKDTLAGNDKSERSDVIGGSALSMQVFYNFKPGTASKVIYNLYENILSGRKTLSDAIIDFDRDWRGMFYANQI
jgi:hypothetical protein